MRLIAPLFVAVILLAGCVAPGTTTTTTPPAGGTGTTTEVDPNTYPLAPPASWAGGLLEQGAGPVRVEADVSNNPNLAGFDTIAVAVNDQVVVAPIKVFSKVGCCTLAGNDAIVIHGPASWGATPKVSLIGIAPGGINGLLINAVTVNYLPLVSQSCVGSGGACYINSPVVFDSFAGTVVFGPPVTPTTVGTTGGGPTSTVTYNKTPDNVAGVTINGAVVGTDTLENICKKIGANDVVVLPAATIAGRCPNSGAHSFVSGQGSTQTKIDGTGIEPAQDKALMLALAPDITWAKMAVDNAAIPAGQGGNAASFRDGGNGIGFNIGGDVEMSGSQNGILSFASNFNIDGENAHDNGPNCDSGCKHDNYFGGGPDTVVNVTNSTLSKAIAAHALKSRAGTTNVSNSSLTAGGNGAALDIPDGGIVNLTNVILTQPGTGATTTLFTYGLESAGNAVTGMTATWTGVKIVDPTGVALLVCAAGTTINLVGNDNTYQGPNAGPGNQGCTVNGSFRKVQ